MTLSRRSSRARRERTGEQGQAIVILAGGLTAIVVMIALIVDIGFAFGERRNSQNAADAAAEAGAGVLAENLIRQGTSYPQLTDSVVSERVQAIATANEVETPMEAYYTDIECDLITSGGSETTSRADAAPVGGGSIPSGAWGVMAVGEKTVDTSFAAVVGMNTIDVAAEATAVSGYLAESCTAETGCTLLPITFLATTYHCADRTGELVPDGGDWVVGDSVTLPLCKDANGNVGWIDWYPPSGGTAELVDTIYNPNNPPITLPDWYWVAQTGNVNAGTVETALNSYQGQVVVVPMFDAVCAEPEDRKPSGGVCPEEAVRGGGVNLWYHFVQFTALYLDEAFITGNNRECGSSTGLDGCIKGRIVRFITSGEVSSVPPTSRSAQVAAVQLIK